MPLSRHTVQYKAARLYNICMEVNKIFCSCIWRVTCTIWIPLEELYKLESTIHFLFSSIPMKQDWVHHVVAQELYSKCIFCDILPLSFVGFCVTICLPPASNLFLASLTNLHSIVLLQRKTSNLSTSFIAKLKRSRQFANSWNVFVKEGKTFQVSQAFLFPVLLRRFPYLLFWQQTYSQTFCPEFLSICEYNSWKNCMLPTFKK